MKVKSIVFFLLAFTLQLGSTKLHAQSAQELQEMLNEPSAPEKGKKQKPAKEKQEKKETPKQETKKEETKQQKQETTTTSPAREEIAKEKPATNTSTGEGDKTTTTTTTTTRLASGGDAKMKELPEPRKLGWKRNRKLGDKLMEKGSPYNAIHYYEEAVNKKPGKTMLYQRLADANFILRDYRLANKYYEIVVNADSVKHKNLYSIYRLALTHKFLGNYEVAKETFAKFNKLSSKIDDLADVRRDASKEAQGCDLGIQLRDDKSFPKFKVTHLNENINQPFTDYAPVLQNANTLYYGSWVSDRVIVQNKREKYADFSRIYVAKKNGNTWGKSQVLADPINSTSTHTGNPTISADGHTMYYTQCLQDDYSRMRCNIYKSTYGSDSWSSGEKLGANVNAENATNTQPSLGKNEAGEEGLYFASDRKPERGMDIYFAPFSGGDFGKARMVSTINTRGNESTPHFDYTNNALYFSSDGFINIGGQDVFSSTIKNNEWSEPVNMGLPINSPVDDMYFNWNEYAGVGFVVSNRPGGFGLKSETCCDDIYQVEKNKLLLAVKGMIQDADSNYRPISNSLIGLYDSTGKEVRSFYAAEGTYFFDLDAENKYRMIARKNGYEEQALSLSTVGKDHNDTMTVDIVLKPIPGLLSYVGQRIGIVYWDFDKDILTNGAPDTLNKVTSLMLEHPAYVLEVGSHTDAKGSDAYNMALSKRRSDAVIKYLISKDIPKYRLESKAYGESVPADLNENPPGTDYPEGRSHNRRTEFKVLRELTPEQVAEAIEKEKKAVKKTTTTTKTTNTTNTTKPATKPATPATTTPAKPAGK
ncbi:MAG: OmpA family protein [Chitinophagales bacterium]